MDITVTEIGRFCYHHKLSQPEIIVYQFYYAASRSRKIVQVDVANGLFRVSLGLAADHQDADCSAEKWQRIDPQGFVARSLLEFANSKSSTPP